MKKEHLCKGSLFESFEAKTAVHVDVKNTSLTRKNNTRWESMYAAYQASLVKP